MGWRARLLILSLVLFPLILVAFFSYSQVHREITRATLSRREAVAALAAASTKEKLDHLVDVGIALASRVNFIQLVSEGQWEEAIKRMETVSQDIPFIERLFITDVSGTETAALPLLPGVIGKNFSHRDWYQGVTREWKPYVSEVYTRAAEPRINVVAVAVPVKKEGAPVGILVLQIRLETLFRWANESKIDASGFIIIVDHKGHIAAHPYLHPQGKIVDYGAVPAAQKALAGEHGVVAGVDPVEKEDRVSAFAPVPGYGWGVVIAEPTQLAFLPRERTLFFILCVYAGIILINFFLGCFICGILDLIILQRQTEKTFLESIGDGVLAIDRSFRVLLWNKKASEMTGWTAGEVLGKSLLEVISFIDINDRIERFDFIRRAMATGETQYLGDDVLLIGKGGKTLSIGDSAAPIFGVEGSVRGVILVFRDITEQKKAYEVSQLLAAIVDSSEDAIFSKTMEGIITSWNKGAERLYGYRAEEMIGHSVNVLIPQHLLEEYESLMAKVRTRVPVTLHETVRRRKDGTLVDVSLTISSVRSQKGKVIGASIIARDITTRKQYEEKLKETVKIKSEFTAMVSHELRTPLTVMMLGLDAVFSDWAGPLTPDQKDLLKNVKRNTDRLGRLIDNVLDYQKLEAGRMEIRLQECDLNTLIEDIVEDFTLLAKNKGLTLSCRLDRRPFKIVCDKDKVHQVLVNLLNNAVKFSERGGLTVETVLQDKEIHISVQDQGMGIKEEDLPKLFQQFSQIITEKGRKVGGTGLGLAICKKIAELHRGRIEVRSVHGKGTTFILILPINP